MANLTRLSVLIGDADLDRGREIVALLKQLGVRHAVQVHALAPLLETLKKRAFDVLLCAERLGAEDGVAVLGAALEVAPATRSVLMRRSARAGGHMPQGVAAIELPFSRAELQALLHRTVAPHGGFWCEVPELSLTDVLQMYHQARRSITVLLSGPIAGRVWLEAGEIVDAHANDERGMEALSYLLASESGLLRTEPHQGHVTRTISAPFQSVILEAARKLDERRRDSRSSTPAGSGPEGSATSQFPGSQWPSGHERTSTSGSMLRPATPPPVEAPAPSLESFFAPARRRRRRTRWVAVLSVIFGVASAALVASYLGNRLGTPQAQPAPETPPTAAADRRATVAGSPREFLLRLPGYSPFKTSQAASDSDVDAAVVLSALPAAVEPSDAGTYEREIDADDPESARSSNPKAQRKDLGIRTRR